MWNDAVLVTDDDEVRSVRGAGRSCERQLQQKGEAILLALARGQQISEVNGVGGKRREIALVVEIIAAERLLLQSPLLPN